MQLRTAAFAAILALCPLLGHAQGALFVLPKAHVYDGVGVLEAGAQVFFYLNSTSTKTPIYTTAALSVEHSNPVEADAYGKLPAIFLDPSVGELKIVVAPSDDTDPPAAPIDTVDDYPTSYITAATIGAALYPRTAAETSASVTPTDYSYPTLDVRRYGAAAADGSANSDQSAMQAAVNVAEVNGGVVYLPEGTWNGCVTVDQENVSIVGAGQAATLIESDDCDAISLSYSSGTGYSVLRDFGITCTNGTGNYGILAAAHSTNSTVELYGLTVERTMIQFCEVAMHARTLRNFTISNNWWQSVDRALELIGKNLAGRVVFNTYVYGGGVASGEDVGIILDLYTYAVGGAVPPEGIQIIGNQFYGFAVDIQPIFVNVLNIIANSFHASEYAIEFTTIQHGLNITDNDFDMNGADIVAGIIGHGLASEVETQIVIDGNRLFGSTSTAASGIVINDAGNSQQYHVVITGNSFSGFDVHDILLNNAGYVTVRDNRCNSTDPTNSISVTNVTSGKGPVIIDGNRCAGAIDVTSAEIEAGEIIMGVNVVAGATMTTGYVPLHTQDTQTGAGAISLDTRLTLLATDSNPDALTLADGFEGQEKIITMITDAGDGVLTPTNLFNGTTITFNDIDDTVILKFIDLEWHVISNSGATRA